MFITSLVQESKVKAKRWLINENKLTCIVKISSSWVLSFFRGFLSTVTARTSNPDDNEEYAAETRNNHLEFEKSYKFFSMLTFVNNM